MVEWTEGGGPTWERRHFAIKYNKRAANDPCAVCGVRTNPTVGAELFLVDSWDVVCWRCGERFAPELVVMLRAWHAADEAFPDDDVPVIPSA